jgi:hypothetical protein
MHVVDAAKKSVLMPLVYVVCIATTLMASQTCLALDSRRCFSKAVKQIDDVN